MTMIAPPKAIENGYFITLEGGEGAGKSTQIKKLAEALRAEGKEVVITREPGGSPGAEQIRDLLVTGDADRWDPVTETTLFIAARRNHLEKTVWPAMARGAWVISDRYADSTMAYQGYGKQVGREFIEGLSQQVLGGFMPNRTIIIDLPVETGIARAKQHAVDGGHNETRFENMDLSFHETLRGAFRDIASREARRCAVIDGTGSIEEVHEAIMREMRPFLSRDRQISAPPPKGP